MANYNGTYDAFGSGGGPGAGGVFCSACGEKQQPDALFCRNCGTPLSGSPAAAASRPEPVPPSQRTNASRRPSEASGKNRPTGLIALVAVLVVAVIGVGAFATGIIPGFNKGDQEVVVSADPIEATVKKNLASYSWEELSLISQEISESGSHKEAEKIAKKYNLLTDSGELDGTQTKTFEVDGKEITVQLIGLYHDEKTDGSMSGLTFMTKECVTLKEFDASGRNKGGWESSGLRSWLQNDYFDKLPSDLKSVIITVSKTTNNVGGENGCLKGNTETNDTLWVPSLVELAGKQSAKNFKRPEVCDMYNDEGFRYALFGDKGVKSKADNSILQRKYNGKNIEWWLRSNTATDEQVRVVTESGRVLGTKKWRISADADKSKGVVFAFCL